MKSTCPGGVDHVEDVFDPRRAPRHPHRLRLDGDAPFAFDVHAIQVLRRMARSSTTFVSCSILSASVDLPWSMCAMMQKLRMIAGSSVRERAFILLMGRERDESSSHE